jgi:Ca2+ transporting ATPase
VHYNDLVENASAFNEELEVNVELKDLIKEAITMNTDARIEIGEDHDETYKYLPKGQALEVGMIDFLLENGEDVQSLFVKRNNNCVKLIQFPFDQELKRKTVVRNNATNPDTVRVYVKGAPEEVIPLCTMTVDVDVRRCEFEQGDQADILQLISDEIAAKGHKPLSYAFKEIDKGRLQSLMDRNAAERDEDDSFRREFESELYYLGTFGLEDRIRPEIDEPINLIKYGHTDTAAETPTQVNVRLVSGDHLETCKAIALRTGIVKGENELKMESTAMTGTEFREAIGPYQKLYDRETGITSISFENPEQFKSVKRRVKVISRATPEDKFVLIRGIQQQGGLIGMAGDSIADAEVLRQADVGLCMGKGCDVAKDHADLVILDNDFASVRRSILWGRAMFDNVRKFLQFQLTLNVSLLSIVFISGATLGTIPFNVIQLLWMNLIMDILAAISLGTEPITEKSEISVTNRETRISRAAKIFLPGMWRNIIVQAAYQIVVLLTLNYVGAFIFFDEPYNLITTPVRKPNAEPTDKMVINTMIFTTFFLMNMVNQINSRVVNDNEVNVFKTLFNNYIFWLVFLIEMAVTHGMLFLGQTKFGTAVLGVTKLTMVQYIVCWALALLALPLAVLAKKAIPITPF